MNKKLIVNCTSKYKFFNDISLNSKDDATLIFNEKTSEKFKNDVKDYVDEYCKYVDFSMSNDKMILDAYEVVELYFEDTEEEENTQNFEIVNIDLICEGYHVEFFLEVDAK